MNTQPEKEEWRGVIRWRPQQPIFGRLSLWAFGFVVAISSLVMLIVLLGSFGERGFGYFVLGITIACIACAANVVIALIGFARRESPRWPAVTGLALSVLPALGAVYILCGAPW